MSLTLKPPLRLTFPLVDLLILYTVLHVLSSTGSILKASLLKQNDRNTYDTQALVLARSFDSDSLQTSEGMSVFCC